jgi:hypothetical protein
MRTTIHRATDPAPSAAPASNSKIDAALNGDAMAIAAIQDYTQVSEPDRLKLRRDIPTFPISSGLVRQ